MDIAEKYQKGGGTSCAVNECSNNPRKLNLWKESNCEMHGQLHIECARLIPYKFYSMPSEGPIRLECIKAINRKTLPKKCSFALNIFLMECQRTEIRSQS
jgi:hypothetical protein